MKKTFLSFIVLLLLNTPLFAQEKEQTPDIQLLSLQGDTVQINDYIYNGKFTVFKFWSSWVASNCMACDLDLKYANKLHKSWLEADQAEVVTVCVDNVQTTAPYVKDKNWSFAILLDTDKKLCAHFGIDSDPAVIITDQDGKILFNSTTDQGSYQDVMEENLVTFKK